MRGRYQFLPPLLIRIFAVFLIPCLIAEPSAAASSLTTAFVRNAPLSPIRFSIANLFQEEAFAMRALNAWNTWWVKGHARLMSEEASRIGYHLAPMETVQLSVRRTFAVVKKLVNQGPSWWPRWMPATPAHIAIMLATFVVGGWADSVFGGGLMAMIPPGRKMPHVGGDPVTAYKRHQPVPVGTFPGGNKVFQLVLTEDGRLVSANYDHEIISRELYQGEPVEKIRHVEDPRGMKLSPDGRWYALPLESPNVGVEIRHLETDEVITFGGLDKANGFARDIAWSPDGQFIAFSHHTAIEVWDFVHRKPIVTLPINVADHLTFSPDNKVLAAHPWGSTEIRLWNLDNTQGKLSPYKILQAGEKGNLTQLAFSPYDHTLVATLDSRTNSGLYFWDIREETREEPILGQPTHRDYTSATLAFVPHHYNGHALLVSATRDGAIDLWDLTRPPDPLNDMIIGLHLNMTMLRVELAGSLLGQYNAYCLAITQTHLVTTRYGDILVWSLQSLIDFPLSDDSTMVVAHGLSSQLPPTGLIESSRATRHIAAGLSQPESWALLKWFHDRNEAIREITIQHKGKMFEPIDALALHAVEDRGQQLSSRLGRQNSEEAGLIRDALRDLGLPGDAIQAQYREVLAALDNPRDAFVWFMGWVARRDRFLIGDKNMLSIMFIHHLLFREQHSDLEDLVGEYLLHEALERTSLSHDQIIVLTQAIFKRPAYDRNGNTVLGRQIRGYVEGEGAFQASQGGSEKLLQEATAHLEEDLVRALRDEGVKATELQEYVDAVARTIPATGRVLLSGTSLLPDHKVSRALVWTLGGIENADEIELDRAALELLRSAQRRLAAAEDEEKLSAPIGSFLSPGEAVAWLDAQNLGPDRLLTYMNYEFTRTDEDPAWMIRRGLQNASQTAETFGFRVLVDTGGQKQLVWAQFTPAASSGPHKGEHRTRRSA